MKNNIHPYPGIHNKVLNKTKIIRQFIWWKKLGKKWKFLETAYILQECLKNQYAIGSSNPPKDGLDWYDVEYTNEPHTFLKCDCGNELITSGSFISDDENGVRYKCTDCNKESWWNFDATLVPIQINGPKLNIETITEFI